MAVSLAPPLFLVQEGGAYSPLQSVTLAAWEAGTLEVKDGSGKLYVSLPLNRSVTFKAGGSLGIHEATLKSPDGRETKLTFEVQARTQIESPGADWGDLWERAKAAISAGRMRLGAGEGSFQTLGATLPAHVQAAKGGRWTESFLAESAQGFLRTPPRADDPLQAAHASLVLAQAHHSPLDSPWVRRSLPAAAKSLADLIPSQGLIQRPGQGAWLSDQMLAVAGAKSLSALMSQTGQPGAEALAAQADSLLERTLGAFSVNGRLADHIPEGGSKAESSERLSWAHVRSLNLGLPVDQIQGLVDLYRALAQGLPPGAPGEWLTLYPPIPGPGEGEGMNGGASGAVAGELALAAFASGREAYGADILRRVGTLLRADRGFPWGWRGSSSSTDRSLTPISLASLGGEPLASPSLAPFGLEEMPKGAVLLAGMPWELPTGETTRALPLFSRRPGFLKEGEILLGQTAASIHLLYAFSPGAAGAADSAAPNMGYAALGYADGSEHVEPLRPGAPAWKGGLLSTASISNPQPQKVIRSLTLLAPFNGASLALAGLTLSDKPDQNRPAAMGGEPQESAGALADALVQGLAGFSFSPQRAEISPRWISAGVEASSSTARLGGSLRYAAVRFRHEPSSKKITLEVSSSEPTVILRVLLPSSAQDVIGALLSGAPVAASFERIHGSPYAVISSVPLSGAAEVQVSYR
jgi:hypothetical protein